MKKFLFFFTLLTLPLFANDLSIVIIGGGPAGLAAAIEAKTQGCQVTLIEKRESYKRPQTLFLLDTSLKLLEKWKVDTAPIKIVDLGDEALLGLIPIYQLEQQLEKRALELGVEKIYDEFQNFNKSYDVIVGADGLHSKVREALGIDHIYLGTAKGAVAKILNDEDLPGFEVSPIIKFEDGFLRRFKFTTGSLIFGQFPKNASKETLQKACAAQGWAKEATALIDNKALTAFDIDVVLSQASTFSNKKKSAIILGDAAATASFFQGMGANTAFKTAALAGQFFKEVQKNPDAAYENYNQAVKEVTTKMIEDSAFLFTSEPIEAPHHFH